MSCFLWGVDLEGNYTQAQRGNYIKAVATSTVGLVSTGPLFETTPTFLPIFSNLVAHPADRLACSHTATVDRVEIDGCR